MRSRSIFAGFAGLFLLGACGLTETNPNTPNRRVNPESGGPGPATDREGVPRVDGAGAGSPTDVTPVTGEGAASSGATTGSGTGDGTGASTGSAGPR